PEQLITPLLRDEPEPPRHQHPILIVRNESDCDPIQMHYVVLPPLSVRRLHINQPQPHPPVVINHPLPERPPPAARLSHRSSVGLPLILWRAKTRYKYDDLRLRRLQAIMI